MLDRVARAISPQRLRRPGSPAKSRCKDRPTEDECAVEVIGSCSDGPARTSPTQPHNFEIPVPGELIWDMRPLAARTPRANMQGVGPQNADVVVTAPSPAMLHLVSASLSEDPFTCQVAIDGEAVGPGSEFSPGHQESLESQVSSPVAFDKERLMSDSGEETVAPPSDAECGAAQSDAEDSSGADPTGRLSPRSISVEALDGVMRVVHSHAIERMLGPERTLYRRKRVWNSAIKKVKAGISRPRPVTMVVWLFNFPLPEPFAGPVLGARVPSAFHAEVFFVNLPPPNLFAFGAEGMRQAYVPNEAYAQLGPPPHSVLQGTEAERMTFADQVVVGGLHSSPHAIHAAMRRIRKTQFGGGYHLLRKNCCTFAQHVARSMCGKDGAGTVSHINYWGDVLPIWLQDTLHSTLLDDDDSDTETSAKARRQTM
mmetsp:Transcript_49104/g.106927  ORF Transcript_49104/g.106927 Transcript_49104/m.106927 type:complete len:427 (-) Transcript_49104:331-1611(-)